VIPVLPAKPDAIVRVDDRPAQIQQLIQGAPLVGFCVSETRPDLGRKCRDRAGLVLRESVGCDPCQRLSFLRESGNERLGVRDLPLDRGREFTAGCERIDKRRRNPIQPPPLLGNLTVNRSDPIVAQPIGLDALGSRVIESRREVLRIKERPSQEAPQLGF
jgi:hypothetical protein